MTFANPSTVQEYQCRENIAFRNFVETVMTKEHPHFTIVIWCTILIITAQCLLLFFICNSITKSLDCHLLVGELNTTIGFNQVSLVCQSLTFNTTALRHLLVSLQNGHICWHKTSMHPSRSPLWRKIVQSVPSIPVVNSARVGFGLSTLKSLSNQISRWAWMSSKSSR